MNDNKDQTETLMNETNKVSYRLVERRKIANLLDSMQSREFSEAELCTFLKKLESFGSEVLLVAIDKLTTAPVDMIGFLCMLIEILGDDTLIPPLVQLLTNENLPDLNKTAIVSVLTYFGLDPKALPLDRIFKNFNNVVKDSLDNLLDGVTKNCDLLPLILEEMGGMPKELQISFLEKLAASNDVRGVPILLLFAKCGNADLANLAIRSLSDLACEESATALKELTESAHIEIHPLAKRELIRLRTQGFYPQDRTTICDTSGMLYKVLISSVDSSGNRGIWFAWRVPDSTTLLDSFNLLININQGLRVCWGTKKVDLADFLQMEQEIKADFWILEDQIDYAYKIVQDALYNNYNLDEWIPIEFAYWQKFLDDDKLLPHPLEVVSDLDALPVLDNSIVIDNLLQMPMFRNWVMIDDSIFPLAEEFVSIQLDTENQFVYQYKWSQLLQKFFNQVFQKQLEDIKKKLLYNLDFCTRFDTEEYVLLSSTIKQVIDSLDEQPYWQNPFLEQVALNSLNYVIAAKNRTSLDDHFS